MRTAHRPFMGLGAMMALLAAMAVSTSLPGHSQSCSDPDMCTPRRGMAVATTPEGVVTIGGASASAPLTNIVEHLAAAGIPWDCSLPSYPLEINLAAAAYDPGTNTVYVFAGAVQGGWTTAIYALPLPLQGSTWQLAGQMQVAREAHAAIAYGGHIYVFGGYGYGGLLGSVERFDPQTGTCTVLGTMPQPSDRFAAACLGSSIYLFGGRAVTTGALLNSVLEYDPASGAWSTVATLPSPYNQFSGGVVTLAAVPDGCCEIILTGGTLSGPSQANQCTNVIKAVMRFTPTTGGASFTPMPDLCVPRQGHGAAILPDAVSFGTSMVVFGGCDGLASPTGNLVPQTESHPCPSQPLIYCTAKTSFLGCIPRIGYSGSPSASSPLPFDITANNIVNNKNGLLFYGFNPTSIPFQCGYLCVQPPIRRTAVQNSGNSQPPPPPNCTGEYHFDFNYYIQSGADPALVPCAVVYAQYWYRDPQSPCYPTGLTDALCFGIGL